MLQFSSFLMVGWKIRGRHRLGDSYLENRQIGVLQELHTVDVLRQ